MTSRPLTRERLSLQLRALALTGAALWALGGCSDPGAGGAERLPPVTCGEGTSGALAAGGSLAVSGATAQGLAGAAVRAPAGYKTRQVTIACAQSHAPRGYRALGPAVSFSPAGGAADAHLTYTLPYDPARVPQGAGAGSLVVFVAEGGAVRLLPLVNPSADTTTGRLSFDLPRLTTLQVAVAEQAGQKVQRRFTYRAIVGFSMGGGAAAAIALRHPELFDFVGPLGGEPAGHLDYFLGMLSEGLFSGFCTAADQKAGLGQLGQVCPLARKPLSDQHELQMSFEQMLYQKGAGVGLTLDRDLYMRGMRDIWRAYGNALYYNPEDPYLPPGVPAAYLRSDQSVCGKPVTLRKFYDREYNPDGSQPVITFCDSNDSSAEGLGVFDPSLPQTTPAQILLAVDLDGDGERGAGEPVVAHLREPFSDVGTDGKADAEEAGYDARANPDPAGDDYHYLLNPTGTEGNWRHDAGEPYEDVGIDGVKGTCQAKKGLKGCYDYGEGNGRYDLSPMARRWQEHDPYTLYAGLDEAQRARLDLWADAGIRDFLNAHVATNGLMGQVASVGAPVRIYDEFHLLQRDPSALSFDATQVDWSQVGKNVYLRYGDPSLSEEEVERLGDGRHVGTGLQIINRTISFFNFAQARWPGGDRVIENIDVSGSNFKKGMSFKSPTTGQDRPFALFLPPGYYQKENADLTYPVLYFLHGYGQDPDELMDLSNLFANYMVGTAIPETHRFQKFIIVYVDGRCRPGGRTFPLPAAGDRCEQGTFYLDTPVEGSTAKMETLMLELMDHIDANYRTKPAEELEVDAY